MVLKYTSATCILYERGDTLGKLLAYVSMAPYIAVMHTLSLVYSRREVHMCVAALGLVLNEGLARGLKHFLRHPRPHATCEALQLCHSFGMPSSHTQCIVFALVLRTLLLARGWSGKGAVTKAVGLLEVAAIAAAASGTAVSRVYLGYHSQDQVAAAAGLGASFAVLWFGLMVGLRGVYDSVARSWLGQLLLLKDTWAEPDPLRAERLQAAGISKSKHS